MVTTLIPVATGAFGAIYAASAAILGAIFIAMAVGLTRNSERPVALRTYLYSLAYLAILFVMMVVDTSL
jgi:protoheme IX farnesyltransferase